MIKPEIRKTTKQDLEALAVIAEETDLFPPELLPEIAAAAFEDSSEAEWLTALLCGQPYGFCFAEPETLADRVWNMRALAVTLGLQGRGLGTALVLHLEMLLKSKGRRMLLVDTSGTEGFAPTRAFYEQNAYEPESRIRDYWAIGDDKVTYRKVL